jgi:cation diffusion facilitator family transporter
MGYTRPASEQGADRIKRIRFVLWTILVLNVAVALAKLLYGIAINSVSMQADGFHSLFDGLSNVVGLVGIGLASRPADSDHPYGHSKYETYASAAIGAMLVLAAYRIGSEAISELTGTVSPPDVDAVAFAIMLGTLCVNIGVTLWERSVGKRLNSEILIADASHTASDAFVSTGVILGLLAVQLGYPKADPIVALLVAAAILRTAWIVFKQANVTLSDTARIPPASICSAASSVQGVLGCHEVRTRGSAAEVYVDLHIQVDPDMSVAQGHGVAEKVERRLCEVFNEVADVIVHLEPLDSYQFEKTYGEMNVDSD